MDGEVEVLEVAEAVEVVGGDSVGSGAEGLAEAVALAVAAQAVVGDAK